MRWGFRVATDPRSGRGHVARCEALAWALCEPVTLFADPGGSIRHGWATEIVLEQAPVDASEAVAALKQGRIGALVIDNYAISREAAAEASRSGFTAMFRDGPPYGPETLTINPSPGGEAGVNVLTGPQFMPLPEAFVHKHRHARSKTADTSRTVLVAFGARDSSDRTTLVLEGLMRCSKKPLASVVMTEAAEHRDAVTALVGGLPWTRIVHQPAAMNELYGDFALAFGAPGVSQFERACCGLPTILIAQNANQEPLAAAWAREGAAVQCDATPNAIIRAFTDLSQRVGELDRIRERGLALVDGRGASRLAAELKTRLPH